MSEKRGRVLGVVSVKGGVGKTTTVSNLGVILKKEHNIPCVLVDANISVPNLGLHMDMAEAENTIQSVLEKEEASMSDAVNIHPSGVHVIPGSLSGSEIKRGSLEKKVADLASRYGLVILDSSPGVGPEPLSVMRASDALVIVTCLDFPSISAALKSLKYARELGRPVLGVVLNRVRGSADELDLSDVKEILSIPILGKIPEDPKVYESMFRRTPVVLFAPQSPASAAYRKLAATILETGLLTRPL